jgi:hypothetical protein
MRYDLASRIMPRTTIDLDAGVLRDLKRRKRTGQSLGQLASELLAGALHEPTSAPSRRALRWRSANMGARIDLEDKEAVRRATDAS